MHVVTLALKDPWPEQGPSFPFSRQEKAVAGAE